MAMQIPFGLDTCKDAHGAEVAEVINFNGKNFFYITPTRAWEYPGIKAEHYNLCEIKDIKYHFVGEYLIADAVHVVPDASANMAPFWINASYIRVSRLDAAMLLA